MKLKLELTTTHLEEYGSPVVIHTATVLDEAGKTVCEVTNTTKSHGALSSPQDIVRIMERLFDGVREQL
jgi:hypothetical protein